MTVNGIDVSGYQGSTYDTSGLSFVMVKATEGTGYINPRHAAQVAYGRAQHLVVGHYHFARSGSMSAQADYFLAHAGAQPGDPLCLDWEDGAVSGADKDAWIKYVQAKAPRNRVIAYCNRDFWINRDHTQFAGDGLWIADPNSPAGHPQIQHPWVMHQYSSAGGVDRNVASFPDAAALRTWAAKGAKPPAPRPTPPPVTAPTFQEDDMLAYITIPAGSDVDIPVEPAGTATKPQGGARNGPIWISAAPQGADTTVTVSWHYTTGKWGTAATHKLTRDGARYSAPLPTDGSVDKVRLHSAGAPLLAYVTGRQVA